MTKPEINISACIFQMLNKRKAIEEQSQSRKMKLDDSALYFQFDREVEETMAWLDEKTKTASDESYKVIVSLLKILFS